MKKLPNNLYSYEKVQKTYVSLLRQQSVDNQIYKRTCSKPPRNFVQDTFSRHNQQEIFRCFASKYLCRKRLKCV